MIFVFTIDRQPFVFLNVCVCVCGGGGGGKQKGFPKEKKSMTILPEKNIQDRINSISLFTLYAIKKTGSCPG